MTQTRTAGRNTALVVAAIIGLVLIAAVSMSGSSEASTETPTPTPVLVVVDEAPQGGQFTIERDRLVCVEADDGDYLLCEQHAGPLQVPVDLTPTPVATTAPVVIVEAPIPRLAG